MRAAKSVLPALLALFVAVSQAHAQTADAGLVRLVDESLAAMDAGKWQESLELSTRAIADYGTGDSMKAIGPQFGAIYYRKGICEIKLGKWDDAMRSLEVCYQDFPNDGAAAESRNVFQKMALLKWGEAAMGAGKWDLALSKFRKFIEERDKVRDKYPQGAFYLNMALCGYHLGSIPEGNENLEIAIRNRRNFPTPDAGIIAGFECLTRTAIAKHNERALMDFIGKNHGGLMLDPIVMHRCSPMLLALAGDAITADMLRAAMAIYQMVPSTQVALDEARARLKAAAGADEIRLARQDVVFLESEFKNGNLPETVKLAGTAYLHERNGNIRGAFAAYEQLELYFPNAESREENFYNLVRMSSLVSSPVITRQYAETFIKDFPNSRHAAELQVLMQK